MMRNRSRAIGGKQGLMSDSMSLSSPNGSSSCCCNSPRSPSLFPSPSLFAAFSPNSSSDSEVAMSPTSILETKSLSSLGNHFFSDRQQKKPAFGSPTAKQHPWTNGESKAIGLGIIDALNEEKSDKISSQSTSRMVLLGSQLKIQIPPLCPSSVSPVGSPIEIGINNRDHQPVLLSPAWRSLGLEMPASSPRVFAGSISMSEMELSEDYTCVISHGPNPKTTHIFDNCIMENTGDGFTLPAKRNSSATDFLSFCCACKKNLEQEKETFMYGGEIAFCSAECRNKEMLTGDELDNLSKASITM
ncbi:hypothetical protein Cni_G16716 [Canna indica]|uniref:FLZ-type domain-containing protein n=1 Tax=Canna indica TaxID=4628 RepID=A0AAQ3QH24_9LILI|nr:hypothetical protein Cni_G16716 [Canna indica]